MKTEKKNLFWLILLRLIVIISLFVSAVIIQSTTSSFLPLVPFYYLILFSYFLSLVYLILYSWGRYYHFQASLQIFFDLVLITVLVYIAGGLTGSLYFLYVFSIIAASLVISSRAAYITAALSAILFGLLVDGMYFGIIPYYYPDQSRELSLGGVLYTIFIAWAVFFVIAILVNYLVGNLKKTREALRLAQKELEIKERLAAAGRISANLAHEIRNPLAAISGSVQVLKNELNLSEEHEDLMEIVLKESSRVSQSIDQFLDLAAPRKQIFSFINLGEILNETLTMLQASGELNGLYRLEGNYTTSKIRYYGNSNQFKQIFWNLTKNALKAMPEGGTLTIDFFQPKKNELQLRFTDTGRGMTEEERERLFEPFYSGFEDGRGLGMVIVRRIVDDYEGRIYVASEPDRGTEILITLPVKAKGKESSREKRKD